MTKLINRDDKKQETGTHEQPNRNPLRSQGQGAKNQESKKINQKFIQKNFK